jgi:hypothetical protein
MEFRTKLARRGARLVLMLCFCAPVCDAPSIGLASDAPYDISKGARLSRSVCSSCHVVEHAPERPPIVRVAAPNFCEIANWSNVTEKGLAYFVTHTHWDENMTRYTMPDLMLPASEAKAVARYIVSLRGHCDFADVHY